MDRRTFVEMGALAGATATSQACTAPLRGSSPPAAADSELRRHLRRLDRMMASLERASPRLLDEHERRRLSAREQVDARLTQSTLRSLLLTGSIGDLPEEHRSHPEVMARLEHAAPEVDYALFGMMTRLRGMPAEEHAAIEQVLRDDPSIVDHVGDCLDRDAKDLGVPLRRRLHLRKLMRHVGWRMQRQSLSTLLDEYRGKVGRLTARPQASAAAVALSPPQSEIDRWSNELARLAGLYAPTTPSPDAEITEADATAEAIVPDEEVSPDEDIGAEEITPAPRPTGVDAPGTSPHRSQPLPDAGDDSAPLSSSGHHGSPGYWEHKAKAAKKTKHTGGVVLGVGAGIGALSGVLVGVGFGASVVGLGFVGLFGLTVAAILLITGIVILSVGAARLRTATKRI